VTPDLPQERSIARIEKTTKSLCGLHLILVDFGVTSLEGRKTRTRRG